MNEKLERLIESYEALYNSPICSTGSLSDDIRDLRDMIGEVINYLNKE